MKVALLGDIGLFGRYAVENNESIFKYFSKVAKYLGQFDYVVGNLELPFLAEGNAIGAKSAYLKSSPKNIELLKYLNINVVTLANNHIYDYGKKGLDSTTSLLDSHDIKYFGVNDKDLLLSDAKIALHGYCCYSTNPYGLNKGVNKLNVAAVDEKLAQYSQQGYLNIISVHAGLEHVNFPAYHDVMMARQLSNTCPYIYYGHHPHVLQGIEKHNDSLLAYSLGNFCFDDVYTDKSAHPLVKQNENNKTSSIVVLDIVDGKLISHDVVSLYMAEDEMKVGSLDIKSILKNYTDFLQADRTSYVQERNKLLTTYIDGRKSMRDFQWYIKRLNYRSVIILLRAKYNAWLHKRNVLNYLNLNDD
jgi:poly-gamma-glutamate synthesis protein (capsule biosynthesis protein)